MKTVFVYMPEKHNHPMAAAEAERTLQSMLTRRGINHSTRYFWDDEMGYAKEGVRLDLHAPLEDGSFELVLGLIVCATSLQFGSIEIQLDANCITT